MKYDVISIGSCTIDLFVDTESELINIQSPHMKESFIAYPSGSKIIIKNREFHLGGGGTNAAYTFSKFGLKTAYLGKIANDEYGHMILNGLKKEKITPLIKQCKGESGFSVILDSIAHDRTILAYKGINDRLSFNEIPKLNSEWIYATSMTGKSFNTLQRIIKNSKSKIVLNPSSYLVKDKRKETLELLKYLYGLICNLEEARLLLDSNNLTPDELLLRLNIYGMNFVIITDGANGVYAIFNKRIYKMKPRKIKVKESTGAGDAFGSGFLGALIKGKKIEDALKLGLINAESVISKVGAKEGILKWNGALKSLRQNSPKLKFRKIK